MRCTGIVAEYNPLHTGHIYHIQKAKKETEAQGIVAVMSGSFVQRGEPAVFDKWTRAFCALKAGVDLVLELPAVYALSSAEGFAKGAVSILKATGLVDTLSFGSECGNLSRLVEAASILESEPPIFKTALHTTLETGASYPAAKMEALRAVNPELSEIMKEPNNTLAVSYLRFSEGLRAHTVQRVGAGYNEKEEKDGYISASAIREKLRIGEAAKPFMPFVTDQKPRFLENYEELILYALRFTDWKASGIVPAGIQKRLLSARTESLAAVLESAKTKHIVMAAIKRALMQILLQNTVPSTATPTHIRVLGFNNRGAEILKEMKKTALLPVICRPAAYKEKDEIRETEIRATDIYFMPERLSGEDIKRPPVFLAEK